jgi:glycerol kinase
MGDRYILAFDAGTTSTRAILFDRRGGIVGLAQEEFAQIFPRSGWVEHDPEVIWDTQLRVARQVIERAGIVASDIAGIGITDQRETSVVWERDTGKPIFNAIVWQDRRTAPTCDALREKGLEPYVEEATGLVIDSYFSATKIGWILDHVEGARRRAEKGELLFGTIDSWLVWKLTGGRAHVTDMTNASRTLLFNIRSGDWDEKLLDAFRIPRAMLPKVFQNATVYGSTDECLFGTAIPVAASVGDQQAALFGQVCFKQGMAKCTYGTSASVVMNTGDQIIAPGDGLISTIAIGLNGKIEYAIEGVLFNCGSVVQWLRDELQIIEKSSDAVATVGDTNGVYFVPAFTGMAVPIWDPYARGTILGLSRGATRHHLVRAALESMAYQVHDVIAAMQSRSSIRMSSLKVDGGGSKNDFVLQFQADLSNLPVLRPVVTESAARGAAFLAGLAVGVWKDRDELANSFELERRFEPEMDAAKAAAMHAKWRKAVGRAMDWEEPDA